MKLLSSPISKASQTVITASSQDAFYPASNLKQHHRAKAWRSSGHWEITDETLVVDSNILTIAPGSYTTSELQEEIQTLLQTLDATFAVLFNEQTFRWTIECDNSFALDLTDGSSLLGFTASVAGTSLTGAKPAHSNVEWITYDFRTTESVDSAVLMWPIGDYKLSSDAIITVEANATNNWSAPAFSESLSFDNKNEVALKFFAPQSFRYWRVVIRDGHNAYGFVELGQCLIGKASDDIIHPALGFKFQQIDTSDVVTNRTLQGFVEKYPMMKVLEFGLDDLTLTETESLLEIFQKCGVTSPVFISLDETESLFTSGFLSIYGRMQSSLNLAHKFRDYFASALTIQEEG